MNQNLQKYGIDLNIFLVIQWGHNFAHVTTAVLSLARADQGSVKGIAYFYVGNGKGVAYFLKTHQANSNSL